jgi:glycosyltransferase involved in cell wall biosynthesis
MNVLLVIYGELRTGGIEDYLFGQIKYAIQKDYRVIWFHKKKAVVAEHYNEILSGIEKIECGRSKSGKWHHDQVRFNESERVTILAYTPFDVDAALILKEENPSIQFSIIFILANTKGRFIYPETSFLPLGKIIIKKIMKCCATEWNRLDIIRAYSLHQLRSYEKEYNINIPNHNTHIVPKVTKPNPLNTEALEIRINRKIFNIISVSRFTFPHKNYLLGLIDDYVILKKENNIVRLHIVGYGHDEYAIKQKINSLPDTMKKDIYMYGELSPDEINHLMMDMHVNISTAGSVWCGARNGVVSLPARNYCDNICEVYGYLPDSAEMTTSLKKGLPAIDFIRELLLLSDVEYKNKCLDSYNTYCSIEVDPEYIFRQNNITGSNSINHYWLSIAYAFSELMVKMNLFITKVFRNK